MKNSGSGGQALAFEEMSQEYMNIRQMVVLLFNKIKDGKDYEFTDSEVYTLLNDC